MQPDTMDGGDPITEVKPPGSPTNTSTIASRNIQPQPAHQRLILTDPVAFRYATTGKRQSPNADHRRYLEEDPSITVLEGRRRLQGYELYIVEQWICSRVHPSFVITTYTGLEQHSVLVGILSVPTNEDEWSPRLRVWSKALAKFHARKKETPLGTIMVTNLSGFPSALTVIPVPEGDVKKHREDFFVNENLKRMGCSGRAGLNLGPPTSATQAKFYQLYHTSDRVPLYRAVIELVKLCQVALVLYGKLAPEYADGLLCDVTEQAINDWWTELGTEYFNVDPTDGILGPTTVSALLGILLGARNRLHTYGAPVAKDVFDLVSTKRGIAYFQKSQKLERTRRLDRQTLDRLHRVTAKAASGEGWAMPRAVKTTVAELSGKGGDMVMGRVGAREKAGIADIETLDIETFVSLLSGERSKWLWYGKPRKNDSDGFSNLGGDEGVMFTKDENGNYIWTSQKRDSVVDDHRLLGISSRIYSHPSHGSQASIDSPDRDQAPRRNVLKTVSGRVTDARSGLGRIKDAVGITGFRGHQSKYSKEENLVSDGDSFKERPSGSRGDQAKTTNGDVGSITGGENAMSLDDGSPEQSPISPRAADERTDRLESQGSWSNRARGGKSAEEDAVSIRSSEYTAINVRTEKRLSVPLASADNQLASDLDADLARIPRNASANRTRDNKGKGSDVPPSLRRTQSLPRSTGRALNDNNGHRLPRHLSFSTFVDVMATEDACGWAAAAPAEMDSSKAPDKALLRERGLAFDVQNMAQYLQTLSVVEGPSIERKVDDVMALDKQATQDRETIEEMYHAKLEEYKNLREATDDLLSEERATLTECVKDMETLGAKLEYELNALQSKVEDMENGIADFERQVEQLEGRAEELNEEKQESWLWKYISVFTGKSKALT